MTLAEAAEHLRDMTKYRYDTLVTFPRSHSVPPFSVDLGYSDIESVLIRNYILQFERQEFGTRTYHVDYKRLETIPPPEAK